MTPAEELQRRVLAELVQSVERGDSEQEYQFGPLARRLSADSDDVRRAMVALDDAGDISVSAREGSWGIHVTGITPQGRRRAAAAQATATAPRDPAHERRRRDARTSAAARALLQYLEEVGDHAAPDSTGVARPDDLDDPPGTRRSPTWSSAAPLRRSRSRATSTER